MLHARIVTAAGSIHYYAPSAAPYDLEVLREHLWRVLKTSSPHDVRLELMMPDAAAVEATTARWLRRVSERGVRVSRIREAA
jgi:hypothetical protein